LPGLKKYQLNSDWNRHFMHREDQKRMGTDPIFHISIEIPDEYLQFINEPQTAPELEDIRHSVIKSKPYGDVAWVEKISTKLGLEQTLHAPGRPKKNGD